MTSLVERRLASLRAILMQSDAEIRAQYPEYFLTYYTYLRIIRNPARIEPSHIGGRGNRQDGSWARVRLSRGEGRRERTRVFI